MKSILFTLIFLVIFVPNINAQFNSLGYDEKNGEWNVIVHQYNYWYAENSPSLVHSFSWEIENKTSYTIVAIDIEFTLFQKGKLFYKKLMNVDISDGANPGEYVETDKWKMTIPIDKSKFDKNTTWSAKVKQVYIPKNN